MHAHANEERHGQGGLRGLQAWHGPGQTDPCVTYNPTDKPVRAVIARTDPKEQESVVLLD